MPRRCLLYVFLFLLPLSACRSGNWRESLDVRYRTVEGRALQLDWYLPEKKRKKGIRFPVVLLIHGGGWQSGDKSHQRALGRHLAEAGYAAVAPSYRLAPETRFPAQIEDIQEALAWIADRGPDLSMDPDQVVCFGVSAGAHLALLAAYLDPTDAITIAKPTGRIRGVVALSGPTDLTHPDLGPEAQRIIRAFVGPGGKAAPASPVRYVDGDDPPTLLFHGTADELVPFSQATILTRTLKEAGVPVRLIPFEGRGHRLRKEDWERVTGETLSFLDKHLSR